MKKVIGTKSQVKKLLLDMAIADAEIAEYINRWESGAETIDDVVESKDGSLYCYQCFDDFHIDYSAIPDTEPVETL